MHPEDSLKDSAGLPGGLEELEPEKISLAGGNDHQGRRSAGGYPFRGAIGESLVFPDRDLVLQPVDEQPARLESLAPVDRRYRDDHGEITDHQIADPMDCRHRDHRDSGSHLASDLFQLGECARMRRVRETINAAAAVVVADSTSKKGGASSSRISDGGQAFVRRQRRIADVEQESNRRKYGHARTLCQRAGTECAQGEFLLSVRCIRLTHSRADYRSHHEWAVSFWIRRRLG